MTDSLETAVSESLPGVRPLGDRVPAERSADAVLDAFLGWIADQGIELYPAQEEALLELMAGRHVILSTPTGSGKSLVATGLHFRDLCQGSKSYYTSPIKALASEKFFALCRDFGADNVGMLTGDASINPEAPIICCTAEVLSNMALRRGADLPAQSVVMDEFHYYSDPERGVAWQVPLIIQTDTQFLLMSATLGNPAPIAERLEARSGREVATVTSAERPVPLEFEYSERPIHETMQQLLDQDRAPVYVVNFTQRECAELAQSLTSLKLTDKAEKQAIRDAIVDFRFDTAYGREMKRFLSFGIGVHHAGLLPKYRLLVEQLSQQGLLKAICGTDTLGVGVNIPIRTVLFRKLCKYDGTKTTILSVRDFKQIAGRAGRKGFDDRGWVVAQAPEHVIDNLKLDAKIGNDSKKAKKAVRKKPPTRGFVNWDETTFRKLIDSPPETLHSRFRMTHGMVLDLIQRDAASEDPTHDNFYSIRELIRHCHETVERKQELLSETAQLIHSLYRSGILRMQRDVSSDYLWVTVNDELQFDFSLMHNLSLYLVETVEVLAPEAEDYALDVVTLAESILEDPQIVLRRQVDLIKDRMVAEMKAERIPYEERMEKLERVTHPKPKAELIYGTFNEFRDRHPWVGYDNIKPKSVGREMYESYLGFEDYVRHYGLQRFEGILLRYLSQLFKTLTQSVPDLQKTNELYDALGYFRALLARVDNSLLREWENLLDPEAGIGKLAGTEIGAEQLKHYELLEDPRAFRARVRAEMHQLVRALAARDWGEAALCVRPSETDPWDEERFESTLAPFFEEYGKMIFTPVARQAHFTHIEQRSARTWRVRQTLLDPEDDNLWHVDGEIDAGVLEEASDPGHDGPLLRLTYLGV